jgi:hypothetical protein
LENYKNLVYDSNLEYGMIAIKPERFKFFKKPNKNDDV